MLPFEERMSKRKQILDIGDMISGYDRRLMFQPKLVKDIKLILLNIEYRRKKKILLSKGKKKKFTTMRVKYKQAFKKINGE